MRVETFDLIKEYATEYFSDTNLKAFRVVLMVVSLLLVILISMIGVMVLQIEVEMF